jgi:hypothetical protein
VRLVHVTSIEGTQADALGHLSGNATYEQLAGRSGRRD